ncbi:MAG: hypothetical protein COV91_03105 [Candidatus Taylorbacteria bacterium CG11_big_fil_rev_8_21_14_0_20_46_11]|uniref:peptidoglycan glycosyltransferase n=1 Tax=Candidatus Taylorbacteria bacterium CG11_big_fil_rev_8_21_14_0_20_46_11 TaxID=1975025 RepID=A0A2H0KE04_9BACT|nr:MAG: hypothetical protein COV91_03105 [Candidatus Taylorbacteria bacterium CG11_big_fil_rev_8_21_14_0_20_46_11]
MKGRHTYQYSTLSRKVRDVLYICLISFLVVYLSSSAMAVRLMHRYDALLSKQWIDRNGTILHIEPNDKGYLSIPIRNTSLRFDQALVSKEDQMFWYHFGFNPFRMGQDFFRAVLGKRLQGSSTLTQQLVKNLLHKENDRTFRNKLVETVYSIALELHTSKEALLRMYENTAYFGEQIQGVETASEYYFGKDTASLSDEEILRLVSTLGSPSLRHPGTTANSKFSKLFSDSLAMTNEIDTDKTSKPKEPSLRRANNAFELEMFAGDCPKQCDFTIDAELNQRVREILARYLDTKLSTADNGAVVVLKLPENEILAIVGSPHPDSLTSGYQLNMATAPRPIGSTAKPFIYLSAFENGARPYSIVDDEENAYAIGTGFAFYPKNYDGKFRGEVTLHQALSNSLNVPSVKVLEFSGLPYFYDLLQTRLHFVPYQPLERYELGIALGALEMDLLTLSHYFTIFPNEGVLRPLTIHPPTAFPAPMNTVTKPESVANTSFVRLVTRILSDREAGVEQFGVVSSLTLPMKNYALKTGTSRDYHDSWTIGYTPDFLVGVWIGNSDNTPMKELSGQSGAGGIWHDVMTYMITTPYNKETAFSFDGLKEFTESGGIEFGLPGDDYEKARLLLASDRLIVGPHDGDTIELSENTTVPLRARERVQWRVNGVDWGSGSEISWQPKKTGVYHIEASTQNRVDVLKLLVTEPQ